MAIYAGGVKCKLTSNGSTFSLNMYSSTPITNGIRLLSSDDYMLKDLNGLYLTIKEGDR